MINLKSLYIINKSHDAYNISKFIKKRIDKNFLICYNFCTTQKLNNYYPRSLHSAKMQASLLHILLGYVESFCVVANRSCAFFGVWFRLHTFFYLGEKVMKKFLSAFLVLTLLLTCVACGKSEPTNTDSTSTTENKTESTTNHTTDGETTTESTTEENTTETESENTTKVQKEENTKENSNSKPTEKPSSTKKPETTTKTNSKPTTTQKPSSTSKPYFVSMELVSVDRYSKLYVNGVHVLDKIYGKNTCFQKGDVITYKINMSDGGKTGFKLKSSGWLCDASLNGNLLTVKINGTDGVADVRVIVDTKNGTEIVKKEFPLYYDSDNLDNFLSQELLIREYARVKGFKLLNGCDEENYKRYVVKIPGNNNWFSEAFASIDEAKRLGYTRYCYQLVPQDAFAMMVYK